MQQRVRGAVGATGVQRTSPPLQSCADQCRPRTACARVRMTGLHHVAERGHGGPRAEQPVDEAHGHRPEGEETP